MKTIQINNTIDDAIKASSLVMTKKTKPEIQKAIHDAIDRYHNFEQEMFFLQECVDSNKRFLLNNFGINADTMTFVGVTKKVEGDYDAY